MIFRSGPCQLRRLIRKIVRVAQQHEVPWCVEVAPYALTETPQNAERLGG